MLRRCGGPVHRRSYSRGSVMARPGFGWGGPLLLTRCKYRATLPDMKYTTTREEDMKANIATCDTCTLEDIALIRVTGYTLNEIEEARERLALLNDLDAAELRGGTQ